MGYLNYIIGVIAFFYAWLFAFKKQMVVSDPWAKGKKYLCNQNLSFLIYCFLTAMLFLGPLSLVKYGVWIVIMLLLLLKREFGKPWNGVLGAYTMFVLWNIYTISYSAYPNQGWMMVLKFSLPYLYFWLGYNAITCKDDFYAFLKRTCWICCIYALIIGGVSAKFITPLYNILNFTSDRLFISYASLADFFAILIPLPLVMYFATKEKKYLFMAGWLFLSTLLESVRTGIGACVLGLCAFYVAYRKWAAIPHVFMGVVLLIVSLFAIPEVREKMFIDDSDNVTVGTVSLDNVEMNGRENMWEMIMDHCYKGHETYGSGCGAALGWLKTEVKDDVMQLIHSDWVQMISESGNVGLGLFVFFVIAMLFKILGTIWRGKQSQTVVFAGSITIASFFACFFAMGFDNVVTYAQQGYVLPFIFLGIFYKAIDIKL